MKNESPHRDSVNTAPTPTSVDRATFEAQIDRLRAREKAHIRQGDDIAAARRRLPVVEVDAALELTGPEGPVTLLDAFDGRWQPLAYYFMWRTGKPAPEQCEGCTWVTTQVQGLSYLHARDITIAGMMHIVSYLRDRDRVFETYWTTRRGVEAMDYSLALMDLTVYGRQEPWEQSPPGWPQDWRVDGSNTRIDGRPIAQWSRLDAGQSDDLSG